MTGGDRNSGRDKVRRAVGAVVRKKGAEQRLRAPARPIVRVVSDEQQLPSRVVAQVETLSAAPDPYEGEPQARALALSALMDDERAADGASFGLLRLGASWRQRSGNEKLELLLSLPDPEATIQALSSDEFVFLAMDIGTNDSAALMTLASPAQMQATVDLDSWRMDRMDRERFAHWVAVCAQAGEMALDRFIASQQAAILTLFLAGSVQVFENREDADEVIPVGREVFSSPDGAFLVAADANDPLLPMIRLVIASVYRIDLEHGRKIVRAVRWELASPMEEQLREDRERRLAEHGFMSRFEAREAYRPADLEQLRAQLDASATDAEKPRPAQLRPMMADISRTVLAISGLDSGRILARALAAMSPAERARLETALTRLAYQLQSARADRASEIDALHAWTRHALATCDMGLQRLAGSQVELAVAALRHLPVLELFRAGHGAVVALHHLARRVRHALGGDAGLDLLDGDAADTIRGLVRGLPERAVQIGSDEQGQPQVVTRPFETLEEVAAVRAALGQVQVANKLVADLGGAPVAQVAAALAEEVDPHVAADLKLSSLVGTAIAWTVLEGAPRVEALAAADVQRLLALAFEEDGRGRRVRGELRKALSRALLSNPQVAEADLPALEALLAHVLQRFDSELGGLDPTTSVDPRFIGTAVAVRRR